MKTKKLFAILTLVVFMMTLLPLASFAATTNTGSNLTVAANRDNVPFGQLTIAETELKHNAFITGGTIIIDLPAGVTFASEAHASFHPNSITPAVTAPLVVAVQSANSKSLVLAITNAGTSNAADTLTINFDIAPLHIKLADTVTGPIQFNVTGINAGVTSGMVTMANAPGGTVAVSTLTVPTRQKRYGVTGGTIRIIESAVGAWQNGQTITLTLPSNVEWLGTAATNEAKITEMGGWAAAGANARVYANPAPDSSGRHQLTLTMATQSTTAIGILDITLPEVNVKETAASGDITVTLGGKASGSVVIMKTEDFAVKASIASVKEMIAGKESFTLDKITIEEVVPASLVPGRNLKLTLPVGYAWVQAPTFDNNAAGYDSITFNGDLSADGRTMTMNSMSNNFTTSAGKIVLKDAKIASKVGATTGKVAVTISGTALAKELTVDVVNVTAPISIEATVTDVQIGKQNQPTAKIVVTENVAGAITARGPFNAGADAQAQLVLFAPDNNEGISFDKTPKAAVIAGDLKLDANVMQRANNNRNFVVGVSTASTTPSKVEISGISLTLNRDAAEGEYDFKVGGSAIARAGNFTNTTVPLQRLFASTNAVAASTTDGVSFQFIRVTTPAPGDALYTGSVTMTVGSTTMVTEAGEVPMDVAPYVKGGRTFFPVTYVAQALGVRKDNIMWDNETKAVTILTDALSIQMKVGDRNMMRNGVSVPMDAAPEIYNGRTMLPIRWLAQYGLGRTVDFANDVVTIK